MSGTPATAAIRMPIAHERAAWPAGWPSVTSSANDRAEMISERRTSITTVIGRCRWA